jgi:hypothetical protein
LRKQSRAFLFQSLTKAFFIGLKAIDRKTWKFSLRKTLKEEAKTIFITASCKVKWSFWQSALQWNSKVLFSFYIRHDIMEGANNLSLWRQRPSRAHKIARRERESEWNKSPWTPP